MVVTYVMVETILETRMQGFPIICLSGMFLWKIGTNEKIKIHKECPSPVKVVLPCLKMKNLCPCVAVDKLDSLDIILLIFIN